MWPTYRTPSMKYSMSSLCIRASYLFPMTTDSSADAHASGGGRIQLAGLSKWYGEQQVLNEIDLELSLIHISEPTRPY